MKSKTYYQKRIKEIIKSVQYLTLATVSKEGTPWNTPLSHAVSDDLSFYFASAKTSQHAKNIRDNGKGFVVIYDTNAPDGEGEGVYVTVEIAELADKSELQDALKIMFGDRHNYSLDQFLNDSKLRAYIANSK